MRWVRDEDVVILQWKDNKAIISLMSSFHAASDFGYCLRRVKENGVFHRKLVRQPKLVADYNKSTWEVLTSQIDSLQNTIFSVKLTSIEKRSFSFYRYSDCKCIMFKTIVTTPPSHFLATCVD